MFAIKDSEKRGWMSRTKAFLGRSFGEKILGERALKDAFEFLDLPLMYFDENGNLLMANCKACRIIPKLTPPQKVKECKTCRKRKKWKKTVKLYERIETLPQFIGYIFDRSVGVQEQTGLFIVGDESDTSSFREIIKLENGRFFLVRASPRLSSGTIVEMIDISMIKFRNALGDECSTKAYIRNIDSNALQKDF